MYRKPGLDEPEAQRTCREVCRAGCCRGPAVLRLDEAEALHMRAHAQRLGVPLVLVPTPTGALLRFPDHPRQRCPMLDDTNRCRIYGERPTRCVAFPEGPRPGCPISSDEG